MSQVLGYSRQYGRGKERMAVGKYQSLEEARKAKKLDHSSLFMGSDLSNYWPLDNGDRPVLYLY